MQKRNKALSVIQAVSPATREKLHPNRAKMTHRDNVCCPEDRHLDRERQGQVNCVHSGLGRV